MKRETPERAAARQEPSSAKAVTPVARRRDARHPGGQVS
jgi:hypothetical protein